MSSLAKPTFDSLLDRLQEQFPSVRFKKAEVFRWVPDQKTIYFASKGKHKMWSLLHEAGHVHSGHESYRSDVDLLRMEVEAWHEAKLLGDAYQVKIDEEHIEDCIDSYRDWLHKRSKCPLCGQTGVENTTGNYRCINCHESWRVTPDRFCRVYRKSN